MLKKFLGVLGVLAVVVLALVIPDTAGSALTATAVLAVNPRKRKRRRRRKSASPKRRRRRRNNPGILRIASNPRKSAGGIFDMIEPAILVSLGAIAGTVIPKSIRLVKPGAGRNMIAAGAIGTGLALKMLGKQFLGAKRADLLAIGATSAGVSMFVNDFLPQRFRAAGLGAPAVITEEEINDEIRAISGGVGIPEDGLTTLAAGDFDGLGQDDDGAEFDSVPSTVA